MDVKNLKSILLIAGIKTKVMEQKEHLSAIKMYGITSFHENIQY